MILGIGIDTVDIKRMEKALGKGEPSPFEMRVFTENERAAAPGQVSHQQARGKAHCRREKDDKRSFRRKIQREQAGCQPQPGAGERVAEHTVI